MKDAQIKMAERVGIHFPTILPIFYSPPNKDAIEDWILRHKKCHSMLGQVAELIGNNINHIDFNKFLSSLKTTVQDFNQRINNQPYVLWIAEHRANLLEQGCSDLWVAGLALEHCGLNWPEEIVTTPDLAQYLTKNPLIKNILLLDDASFSGKHISDQIYNFTSDFWQKGREDELKSLTLHISIPYQTTQSTKIFNQYSKELTVNLLIHQHLPTLEEMYTQELKQFTQDLDIYGGRLTLTYFDHALPDFMSTHRIITTSPDKAGNKGYLISVFNYMLLLGYCISSFKPSNQLKKYCPEKLTILSDKDEVEKWNKLVCDMMTVGKRLLPEIVRPYRLHQEFYQQNLKEAIKTNSIGQYTGRNIPFHYQAAIEIIQAELSEKTRKAASELPFFKTMTTPTSSGFFKGISKTANETINSPIFSSQHPSSPGSIEEEVKALNIAEKAKTPLLSPSSSHP